MQAYRNNIAANDVMKPLLKSKLDTVKDYGVNGLTPFFNAMYKNYYNGNGQSGWGNYGQILLKNGIIIFTECSTGCYYIHVFIDINVLKGPNRQGHDLFDFQLNSENQLVPATQFGVSCNINSPAAGFDCTSQALSDLNYFKKLPR